MKWIYKSLLHDFTYGIWAQWGMKETIIIAVLEKMEEEGTETET